LSIAALVRKLFLALFVHQWMEVGNKKLNDKKR